MLFLSLLYPVTSKLGKDENVGRWICGQPHSSLPTEASKLKQADSGVGDNKPLNHTLISI